MARPALLLALSACLLAAACGGAAASPGAASPAAATSGGPTAPSAASIAPVTASQASASGAPSAGASLDGTALCAFLKSELPALQGAGSTGGAVAVLAIDYASWIEADPSRKLPDAAAMDTATQASCPATRTAVLKALGGDSFAVAF
jgi:hypothetical protein